MLIETRVDVVKDWVGDCPLARSAQAALGGKHGVTGGGSDHLDKPQYSNINDYQGPHSSSTLTNIITQVLPNKGTADSRF
jgi:hypothetical protein